MIALGTLTWFWTCNSTFTSLDDVRMPRRIAAKKGSSPLISFPQTSSCFKVLCTWVEKQARQASTKILGPSVRIGDIPSRRNQN